jgi:ubiquinone/menaquinone biosynthesis C-methylase UbiE
MQAKPPVENDTYKQGIKTDTENLEAATIAMHYADRAIDPRVQRHYGPTSAGDRYMTGRRDRSITDQLQRYGKFPLWGKLVLDIGCGSGWHLRRFVEMGMDPSNCYGIDLNGDRLTKARTLNAHMTFIEGSAENIPLPGGSVDIVTQFTAFSSMPSEQMQQAAAHEMLRLVKPDGIILWYDLRVRDPRNLRVTAMPAEKVKHLFAGCRVDLQSHTLAPPISRMLAPRSEIACLLLDKVPLFHTHYIATISP